MSSIIVAVLVLLLSVVHPVDAKKKTMRKANKELIGETFRLKVPLVKLSYSLGPDEHSTHVYGDSSIVYRVKAAEIARTAGDALVDAIGGNEIANSDPQDFVKEVRDNNKKYKGQILPAGSRVTIQKINFKEKTATVYLRTLSDLESRVYLDFKTKKYQQDDFDRFFDMVFEDPTPALDENSEAKEVPSENGAKAP